MPVRTYCWDAGIFITILKGEQRSSSDMAGLREVQDMISREQARIITSALAIGEVLNHPQSHNARPKFDALFKRRSFFMVDTTGPIWAKIASVREAVGAAGRRIQVGDAAYIATAIEYKADALHTFDEDHLIPLSGLSCVDGLIICKPHGEQTVLL
jgi:predicted nucleic acid-binding protein